MADKNIVYCLCAYLSKDISLVDNIKPVIKNIKKWAHANNADFKLITKIPDVIEDMFVSIKRSYENKETKKYSILHKKDSSKLHTLKAWNTKFEIIHDFYKSNYKKMMYFDCDILLEKNNSFNFSDYSNIFYIKKRIRKPIKNTPMVYISEKYLHKKVTGRYGLAHIFLCKEFEINLKDIFNYKELYELWLLDDHFLREEIAATYLIHKYNIQEKITQINFNFGHIGGPEAKRLFTL